MSIVNLDIDRLSISLHGVSAGVAQEAVADLAQELRRRLSNLPPQSLPSLDMGGLAIGPLQANSTLDATSLRDLIADRLVQALFDRQGDRHAATTIDQEEIV
jgi:hypothetical protein